MTKLIKNISLLVLVILFLSSCQAGVTNNDIIIPSKQASQIISSRAREVIVFLRDKNMNQLANFVHPSKGVRFSPYGYVNVDKDLVFKSSQISNLLKDKSKYVWGVYDGTGDPINLTPQEYYDKFVYSADFANAETISYNKIVGHGNNLENQFEVYPGSIIVEYYFSGFDPKYQGLDWQSLRLVFEKYRGKWYLVGIIHNQWTI